MSYLVPLVVRGRVILDPDLEFGTRGAGVRFRTPDVRRHLAELVLKGPSGMKDLHALQSREIVDFLVELGQALRFERNAHMREASELSALTSGLARETVLKFYQSIHLWFDREFISEMTDNAIGLQYLDGWVPRTTRRGTIANVRAFGARNVQIISGNVPMVAASSIIRNAMTRSDAIIKTPSNDPITAAAIARTMAEIAPDHPLTRHLSVAYWKGGDNEVEQYLYRPDRIEKIVAWGGLASISHISRFLQPGIDLITLDPKLSSSIIGRAAFADEATQREVAHRLAIDIACYNQQACANARVVYVESGTDADGRKRLTAFGKLVYEAIQALPPTISGPSPRLPAELADELSSLKVMSGDHKVFGGGREGAIVVSQLPEPVEFATILSDRVANLVPVDDFELPVGSVTAYTQTIGVYPDSVKEQLRDRLAVHGAQRIVSLGYAMKAAMVGPHDGMEPYRRMCKWIVDETSLPSVVPLE